VLDTGVMVGAIPSVYGWDGSAVSLDTYFAMARGEIRKNVPALEMTKWFDTNYHYMVPELTSGQSFKLASTKPLDEYLEAVAIGLKTRPVLLGPLLTFYSASQRMIHSIPYRCFQVCCRYIVKSCAVLRRRERIGFRLTNRRSSWISASAFALRIKPHSPG
jgi:Cobalamin-independent synthase, N-terminal domain